MSLQLDVVGGTVDNVLVPLHGQIEVLPELQVLCLRVLQLLNFQQDAIDVGLHRKRLLLGYHPALQVSLGALDQLQNLTPIDFAD